MSLASSLCYPYHFVLFFFSGFRFRFYKPNWIWGSLSEVYFSFIFLENLTYLCFYNWHVWVFSMFMLYISLLPFVFFCFSYEVFLLFFPHLCMKVNSLFFNSLIEYLNIFSTYLSMHNFSNCGPSYKIISIEYMLGMKSNQNIFIS